MAEGWGRTAGRKALLALTVIVCAAGGSVCAWAQAYPTKAIKLIVPFPPGGGADILGRSIGAKLGEVLGQQVVVDNRPAPAV